MRIYTKRANEFKIGEYIKDAITSESYFVVWVGRDYIDVETVQRELRRNPTPPQKYYQKFNKGWNR